MDVLWECPQPATSASNNVGSIRDAAKPLVDMSLTRDGDARGTTHVLFAPASIRGTKSPHAYLLYSFDPSKELEVYLRAHGKELKTVSLRDAKRRRQR